MPILSVTKLDLQHIIYSWQHFFLLYFSMARITRVSMQQLLKKVFWKKNHWII